MKSFILKIWGYVEDIIFGRSDSFYEEINSLPRALNEHSYIFSIFEYKNSKVKKLIWDIKYKGNRNIPHKLAEIFYDYILEDLGEKLELENFVNPIILPLPATKRRIKDHGFNQCERIVRALESLDQNENFGTGYNILFKTKETASQAHMRKRITRLSNMKDSFGIKKPEKISGRNIILIDDVWTTGATISEARNELLKAGARNVIAYTVAH